MTGSDAMARIGKGRIVEPNLRNKDHLDLVQPADISIRQNGRSQDPIKARR